MPGRGFAGLGLVEGSSTGPSPNWPLCASVSRVRWTRACKWIRRIFRWSPGKSLITRWLSIYLFAYDDNNDNSNIFRRLILVHVIFENGGWIYIDLFSSIYNNL